MLEVRLVVVVDSGTAGKTVGVVSLEAPALDLCLALVVMMCSFSAMIAGLGWSWEDQRETGILSIIRM